MAWTPPRTWVTNDPVTASLMNTQFRDNLNYLKSQSDDAASKLGQTYPAFQNPRLFKAVIRIDGTVSVTNPQSLTAWHANCKLTFTPQTDEVLFGVQYIAEYHNGGSREVVFFGLQKGSTDVSIQDTASISGNLDQTSLIALYRMARDDEVLVSYQAPVQVTRNVEVSISPTVRLKGNESGLVIRLYNPSRMILTALDVGSHV